MSNLFPDVGYANFINVILNEYFTQYFDRAIALANELRSGGYVETFSYTTHPWLVSLYLDCPPNLTLANYTLKVNTCSTQGLKWVLMTYIFTMSCTRKSSVHDYGQSD